jgi:hypothetical protein
MQVSKPAARAGVRSIAIAQNADNAIAVAMIPRMASLQPAGRLMIAIAPASDCLGSERTGALRNANARVAYRGERENEKPLAELSPMAGAELRTLVLR